MSDPSISEVGGAVEALSTLSVTTPRPGATDLRRTIGSARSYHTEYQGELRQVAVILDQFVRACSAVAGIPVEERPKPLAEIEGLLAEVRPSVEAALAWQRDMKENVDITLTSPGAHRGDGRVARDALDLANANVNAILRKDTELGVALKQRRDQIRAAGDAGHEDVFEEQYRLKGELRKACEQAYQNGGAGFWSDARSSRQDDRLDLLVKREDNVMIRVLLDVAAAAENLTDRLFPEASTARRPGAVWAVGVALEAFDYKPDGFDEGIDVSGSRREPRIGLSGMPIGRLTDRLDDPQTSPGHIGAAKGFDDGGGRSIL